MIILDHVTPDIFFMWELAPLYTCVCTSYHWGNGRKKTIFIDYYYGILYVCFASTVVIISMTNILR